MEAEIEAPILEPAANTHCLVVVQLTQLEQIQSDELQVPNQTVRPMLTGEDCVPLIFGISIATVRITEALKTYHNVRQERQTTLGP